MTHIQIGDTTPRRQFDADGEQLAFDFTFPIFQDDDLDVYVDQAQMVLDTDYSVTGAGESAGGTVTFFTAPANNTTVTLVRRLAIQRTTDFQESGELRSKVLNDELDYQTAALQQVADDASRGVRLHETDAATDMVLPAKADRADRTLGFDANGAPVAGPSVSEVAAAAAGGAAAQAAATAAQAAQVAAEAAAEGVGQVTPYLDRFDAGTTDPVNGSNTTFTLSATPPGENALIVTIDTVVQDPANYSLAGDVLTYDTPPSGTTMLVWYLVSGTTAGVPTDASVTTAKLADGAVTTVKVSDGAITSSKLADDSVEAAKIADGAVETDALADSSVTLAKLDSSVSFGSGVPFAVQTFTTANDGVAYTPTTGTKKALVFITSGGQGGAKNNAGYGQSGNPGSVAVAAFNDIANLTGTVTVGSGGSGATGQGPGGSGGTSSIGSAITVAQGSITAGTGCVLVLEWESVASTGYAAGEVYLTKGKNSWLANGNSGAGNSGDGGGSAGAPGSNGSAGQIIIWEYN